MFTRRQFLKQSSALTAGLMISSSIPLFAEKEQEQQITLLHTNDVHSRLDPFPMDGGKYQGLGGAVARDQMIRKIREEGPPCLLLDAGDMFQGTPYFNYFHGEAEIQVMNQMKYDAGTIGNHDFDQGIENLANQISFAKFPLLNCNYDFSGTPLELKIPPYQILKKGRIKVGLLGVGIELQGLVPDKNCEGIIYSDPIEKANEISYYLKKNRSCDFVVCLSHLGFEYKDHKVSDQILAKETDYIDCIIGGHTHTFLEKPLTVKNRKNQEVIINQVGWAGINLGRLNIFFGHNNRHNYTSEVSAIKINNANL